MTTTTQQTVTHNLAALDARLQRNATAVVTGDTCPECGEGANPTILQFGHCLRCQSATFGR